MLTPERGGSSVEPAGAEAVDVLRVGSQSALLGDDALDLAGLLNTVLDKGAAVYGDVTIAVADVDLIRLNLGLVLHAVETAMQKRPSPAASATGSLAASFGPPVLDRAGLENLASRSEAPPKNATSLNSVAQGLPERINADAEGVESGLARLVLTLIEVLRKVLEHQAVRRMEGGRLSEEDVERLGLALSKLDDRMQDLKRVFGLSDEDLKIDLGPLGRLR